MRRMQLSEIFRITGASRVFDAEDVRSRFADVRAETLLIPRGLHVLTCDVAIT
jgi:hypothetical protein